MRNSFLIFNFATLLSLPLSLGFLKRWKASENVCLLVSSFHDRVHICYLALIDVLSLFILYAGCTQRLRGAGKEEIIAENRPIMPQVDTVRDATAAPTATIKISTFISFILTHSRCLSSTFLTYYKQFMCKMCDSRVERRVEKYMIICDIRAFRRRE